MNTHYLDIIEALQNGEVLLEDYDLNYIERIIFTVLDYEIKGYPEGYILNYLKKIIFEYEEDKNLISIIRLLKNHIMKKRKFLDKDFYLDLLKQAQKLNQSGDNMNLFKKFFSEIMIRNRKIKNSQI